MMASRLLRTFLLALLGTSLGSPPLRTLQLTAERTAPQATAPAFQQKQQRARTVNPRLATLPKARADSCDLTPDWCGCAVGSDDERSNPSFVVHATGKLPRRDPFYHPLRC
jgi:hypothetical protein